MAIARDFTDAEGNLWDLASVPGGGLAVTDGSNDAYDGGHRLLIVGETVDHQNAFLRAFDQGLETEALSVAGLQVSRVFDLVEDPEGRGVARFVEVFHNPGDETVEIEVTVLTDLGSDADATVLANTNAEGVFLGFASDDARGEGLGDPVVLHGWGDFGAARLRPSEASNTDDFESITFAQDAGDGVFEIEIFAPREGGFVRMVQTFTSPSGQPMFFDLSQSDFESDDDRRLVHEATAARMCWAAARAPTSSACRATARPTGS